MKTEATTVAIVGGTRGLWGEAVAWMLTSQGYELVAAFDTVAELMVELVTLHAELVLIDLDDRPIDWLAIGRLRTMRPDLKLILITAGVTADAAEAIRANHLDGVIEKGESAAQARATLVHVRDGRRVFPAGWQDVARREHAGTDGLSPRESAILELVASGLRNGEIAGHLMISQNTVKFHLRAVYARIGVRNRIEAAQAFGRLRGESSRRAPARRLGPRTGFAGLLCTRRRRCSRVETGGDPCAHVFLRGCVSRSACLRAARKEVAAPTHAGGGTYPFGGQKTIRRDDCRPGPRSLVSPVRGRTPRDVGVGSVRDPFRAAAQGLRDTIERQEELLETTESGNSNGGRAARRRRHGGRNRCGHGSSEPRGHADQGHAGSRGRPADGERSGARVGWRRCATRRLRCGHSRFGAAAAIR